MIRVAINGFGRIGRNCLRACYEGHHSSKLQVVAVNDLGNPEVNTHLLQYDSTHGYFSADLELKDRELAINGNAVQMLSERNPRQLPWEELQIDIVLECTGLFTDRDSAKKHLQAGAKRVLVSAPGTDMDATIVYGVNEQILTSDHHIVSNASCTTNCLAPLAQALHQEIGIKNGLVNTVHAYTNDQNLVDVYHPDVLRARSAPSSMIPTKTGAAAAIGSVIPELDGKLDGLAVRVPVINVSLLDLTFQANRETSAEEVNATVMAAASKSTGKILQVNQLPLVSSDFKHNPASCIFDATQTRVIGNQVKVLAWYDNEWGFSNRMLDNAIHLASL